MPCYDDRDRYANAPELLERVNKLTRLLCEACSRLEATIALTSPELRDWWADHQRMDAARTERDRAIQRAHNKTK